jgi:glycosyltransferase involved in cell wall biosynthesis
MRVAVVSDYLPGYHKIWSGAELIAVTLSEMLQSKQCEVFFLTTPFDSYAQNTSNNVYPVRTPLKGLGTLSRNFPVDIGAISDIYKKLKKKNPDIVHINAKYLFLPTIIACLSLKIPAVFTVPDYFIFCPTSFIRRVDGSNCTSYHGKDCYRCLPVLSKSSLKNMSRFVPESLIKSLLALRAKEFDYFIKKVSAYVVLSNLSKKRLTDYGIPEEKVKLIYHYKLATPRETKETILSPSAVFVGWLSEENGTDILIKAFALALKEIKNARLYLVGTGKNDFMEKIRKEIVALNIADNVVFLGKKDNPEALSIISKCDVVVVPHQWPKEFGPIILIEALALGKPVITSKIGATDEFVKDGDNGFLVEGYKNPEAFAKRLARVLSNPETAKAMGRKARESTRLLFGDSQAADLIELYNSLTNGGKS